MLLFLLAQAMPNAQIKTFEGAGHVPDLSHPEKYVEVLRNFCFQHL